MINYKEFEIIRTLVANTSQQTDIAAYVYASKPYYVFKSLEEVQDLILSLERKGYIKNGSVTKAALEEIAPLKVKNAVILAAGGSDISAKSVYSMPKGLYVKNGETLIERQIRQLKEVGIDDITVVVGYKQEMYFFLEEKWNVKLRINPDLKKNNIYSLYMAVDLLNNTYICNCDNYFEKNPFFAYEYNSFHATVVKDNAHNELLVKKNTSGRITKIYSDNTSGECIYGHAYIDGEFSKRLVKFMHEEIDDFRVTALFWEEFIDRHIEDLDMYVHEYSGEFLYEFDSIQEIQNIDSLFLENVSGKINDKICSVLDCNEEEIGNIVILQKGLTNVLFTFAVRGKKYIFRYPGESSSFFIYRKNECRAQILAARAKVDNTYVYIDETGIKISRFMENCENLDGIYYSNIELMKLLAQKIRKFHEEGFEMSDWKEFEYNPIQQCERLMLEASKMKGNLFEIFKNEWDAMRRLYSYAERDGVQKTMCHNDINQDNCLLNKEGLNIIDWEFAGFNDPAYDFGRVIAGYDFEDKAIDEILKAYFDRPATELERLHWITYMGIHNWYYVGWALYKESINESSRDWMLFFYKQAKRVIEYALPRYENIYGK
ncbi:phosphotransferase [Phascolarctobacterium faecium]|uniref:phosphotransferase n=1 Tax=Phascolarctobacterium faecium TaxID=33025 RepID=UPI0025991835|nr:phosphotransferase [uncultured Phascolarctobacterium sp.]